MPSSTEMFLQIALARETRQALSAHVFLHALVNRPVMLFQPVARDAAVSADVAHVGPFLGVDSLNMALNTQKKPSTRGDFMYVIRKCYLEIIILHERRGAQMAFVGLDLDMLGGSVSDQNVFLLRHEIAALTGEQFLRVGQPDVEFELQLAVGHLTTLVANKFLNNETTHFT